MINLSGFTSHKLMAVYLLGFIYLLQCSVGVSAISVMSVDFGGEWMKVAIVSPGVPMEIALNKESKRKTPVAVAFRDGERTFGEDAQTVGVRFPKNCYIYLLELLGKDINNPLVQLYKERFPYYDIIPDKTRNTVVFKHDEETEYSVEELVGMLLHKAQEMAEQAAGQKVTDAVITVPGYFNQAERKAMMQAAQLAGINVLQLINDYTAAALNYGIFRRKDFNDSAQYIMLYDMGATSTTATVISYQTVKTKERGIAETNPQLTVLGVGYDRTLGGMEMQMRLQKHLAVKFNELKKTKNDVTKNPRSMAKLFKEAGRVKNVLSANADHHAQVEGLIDEIDFKLQVTRDEYESMVSDLIQRVSKPIDDALKTSHLTLDVISQVILIGAGTRMPAVQSALVAATGKELGKSLNTDEAAVMGAAYKAADLSKGFKVKKFITKDAVLFPIQVSFEREGESGNKKEVKRMLFGLMNPYPQKKIMTFNKHTSDFDISVSYSDMEYLSAQEILNVGPLKLSHIDLTGVDTALAKHSDDGSQYKGVKAHFHMDDSGLLSLINAELIVEKTTNGDQAPESTFSKIGASLTKLFSGSDEVIANKSSEETGGESGDKVEDKKVNGSEANKTREGNSTKEGTAESKPQVVVLKEQVSVNEKSFSVPSMVDSQITASASKLAELNAHDEAKYRREGALNSLESSVFDTQNKLETNEYKAAASPAEIQTILSKCKELASWLEDEGWESEVGPLEAKLAELKKLTEPLWKRVREHHERPEALSALAATINGSQHFLAGIKNMTEHRPDSDDPMFTQVEVDTLEKTIREVSEWKEKSIREQSEVPLYETPKLTLRAIVDKMHLLDREVKYLVNKAKFWRPKTKEPPAKEQSSNQSDSTGGKTEKKTDKTIEPPSEEKAESGDKTEGDKTEGGDKPPVLGAEDIFDSSDKQETEQTSQPETEAEEEVEESENVHTEL